MSIPSTPNPLQTANVGVTIPTEAIDAAVERMFTRMEWASLHWLSIEPDQMRHLATAALTAAAPYIQAAALREAAVDLCSEKCDDNYAPDYCETCRAVEALHARAAELEGNKP